MSTLPTTRCQRWRDFLKPDAAPGFLFLIDCTDPAVAAPAMPHLWPSLKRQRIENAWCLYQAQLRRSELIDDDSIPFLENKTGTEIFAEALGCAVERPETTMPFAQPRISDAAEVSRIRVPELASSTLAYLFDIADELQRRAGPDALQHLVDIQSPMDIAALVWEKSDFLSATIEAPEAVHELAAKAEELLCAFLDEWFARYGTKFIAHFPNYYMEGGLTLSEDEIGAVNEETFQEFFAEPLARLSKRYGGIGIHCCADSRHQWKNLAAVPSLRMLNLNCPPHRKGSEFTVDSIAFFADKCAQWPMGWAPGGSPESWPAKYPSNARVVLQLAASTLDEAKRLSEALRAAQAAAAG